MINFNQNLYIEEHNFTEEARLLKGEHRKSEGMDPGDIPTSRDISGIEIRLSRVLIEDNHTSPFLFFPGRANLYFLNVVLSDLSSDGVRLDLKGFEKVDDGDSLNVDKTLFFWKKTPESSRPPSQIHIMSSLVKSKQSLRNTGEILSKVKQEDSYKSALAELAALVKSGSAVTQISNLVFNIAGLVGSHLGKVEDKPLLTWFQSFTDVGGDLDKTGKTVKEAANKYASMRLTLYLRDKSRNDEQE